MESFLKKEIDLKTKERIIGKSYPYGCKIPFENLRLLNVLYIDFSGETKTGELIVGDRVADDVIKIFKKLFEAEYKIEKINLIDDYDADDDRSVANNNSSAFCYRLIANSDKISNHAFGTAIDINPRYNPYIVDGKIAPHVVEEYAFCRQNKNPYYIEKGDVCYNIFKQHGFLWGGDWGNGFEDYQHFYKEAKDVYPELIK